MKPSTAEAPILTVSEITQAIKQNLESTFPSLWIQGEVSNCKLHTSGHLYFTLKDAQAQIAAVMFRGSASALKKIPKDGDSVIVSGGLNVFPPSGRYQIQVLELRFAGLGELLLKLEELKKKIHKKGWFSREHKKPLPKMPRTIGVVTSPTGAVIQDILKVLSSRAPRFHLILNPVRVQGEGAAQEIARAIQQFNETNLADVLIIGRGGGSIEDLWAFNEEIVAEAVFHSKIPIIAAVGHETDHCIAEYVADARAPTPSAAAEMAIAEKIHQIEKLHQIRSQLSKQITLMLRHCKTSYQQLLKQPLIRNPYLLIGQWMQKLDDAKQDLDGLILHSIKHKKTLLEAHRRMLTGFNPQIQINLARKQLSDTARQLDRHMKRKTDLQRERLGRVSASLQAVDPKNLLARGYSILFSEKDQSIITSVHKVKKTDRIKALLKDGEILSAVEGVRKQDVK